LKRIFSFLSKIFISALLLIFLFRRIDFQATLFYISHVNYYYFIIAGLIFVAIHVVAFFRWKMLLDALKKNIPPGRMGIAFLGGCFFNLFLPSSIGGDAAKVIDLSLYTKDSSPVLATTILDRLCGFTGLVIVAFFGCCYGLITGMITDLMFFIFILFLAIVIITLWGVFLSRRFFRFITKIIKIKKVKNYLISFHDVCCELRFQKNKLLKAVALSLLVQGGAGIVCYYIGLSIGIKINFIYFFVFIPIVLLISMIPISLGGLGIRDNAAVFLFSSVGVANEKIAAMTLLLFFLYVCIGLIGGSIYGFALHSRRLQHNKENAPPQR